MRVGDLVPDFTLVDDQGASWSLAAQRGRPVVLIFHRHLMCLPCQEHLRAVRDRLGEFGDAVVAVVTFAPVRRLDEFRQHLGLPFPVLADPERDTYRRFGLERASFRHVYNLGTLRMYARLLRQGRRARRPIQDTRQLGGDFVIDGDSRLVYASRPPSPDTRPPVDELIAAVRNAATST